MKKENLVKTGVRYPLGKFPIEVNLIPFDFVLGFTFSFPCKQEGLASARLTSWTKGFTLWRELLTKMLLKCFRQPSMKKYLLKKKLFSSNLFSLDLES